MSVLIGGIAFFLYFSHMAHEAPPTHLTLDQAQEAALAISPVLQLATIVDDESVQHPSEDEK